MKLLLAITPFLAFVAALPPHNKPAPANHTIQAIPPSSVGASCQTGQLYCLNQIISDLKVDPQRILHQYCDQTYPQDALSCHGCKRPFPVPKCGASPWAWNSVFKCRGQNDEYDFAFRCENWCEAGKCI